MKNRKMWLGSTIVLTLVTIGAAFISPFDFTNNLFRVHANTYTEKTIVFDKSNSSKSGTTNSTTGSTYLGHRLVCKSFDNDSTQSKDYVGALKNGSTVRFYESDGSTEFTFEDIDKIVINKDTNNFGFKLHYVYDDGVAGSSSFSTTTNATRTIGFTGSSYGNVSNLWLECVTTDSSVAKINSITLTYNCTDKHQTGVSITTDPYKTTYNEGESFDTYGMVVKAIYDNNTSVATKLYTVSPSGPLTPSDTYVTISFGGFSTTKAITVIDLPDLVGIFVDTAPNKTTYTAGELFSASGMVVKARYSDNSTETITGYTYTPSGALTTSDTSITISYEGFTTTQAITVSAPSSDFDDTGTYSMSTSYGDINYTLSIDFDNLLHTMVAGNQTYRIHFTYVITNKNITFTADLRNGDSDYADFGNRYRIFYDSSDKVNSTGTISENNSTFSLTLYRVFGGKQVTGTYTFEK